jgi:hypothetical protein
MTNRGATCRHTLPTVTGKEGIPMIRPYDYYKVKYSLPEDDIATEDQLLRIDPQVDMTKERMPNGQLRALMLTDFQIAVGGIQLIPPVPTSVKTVFNGAKKLFVFGYFEYYFLSVCLHYLLLSTESGLRNRYLMIHHATTQFTPLKKVIRTLVNDGVIDSSDERRYESATLLRNEMSHLLEPKLLPASKTTFESIASLINALFDEE